MSCMYHLLAIVSLSSSAGCQLRPLLCMLPSCRLFLRIFAGSHFHALVFCILCRSDAVLGRWTSLNFAFFVSPGIVYFPVIRSISIKCSFYYQVSTFDRFTILICQVLATLLCALSLYGLFWGFFFMLILWCACVFDDDLTLAQFPWNLARGHETGWKIFFIGEQQTSTYEVGAQYIVYTSTQKERY